MAKLTVAAVDDALVKTKAERKLRYYLEHIAWPVIEPLTTFRPGWHLDAMCDHAQALSESKIRNLLVTIAPRHTKSIVMSVALPSWAWATIPELRFLYASFSADLSLEHAVLSRRVIMSEKYQRFWGQTYQLTSDQNVKSFYENSRRGYRISASVGGTVIGRGGDILALDDPHNLATIDSDLERHGVIHFYQHVWSGRFNDPKTGRRLLIMQRGHEGDLAEHVMSTSGEQWTHLNLPTEYEPTPMVEVKGNVAILRGSCATEEERDSFEVDQTQLPEDVIVRNEIRVNPLGWKDPRTIPGELLNPDRFGPDEIANAKRDLGPMGYATQHQQRPMPLSGGMFKRDRVKVIQLTDLPKGPYSECRGWDQAASVPKQGQDPDFTVGAKLRRYVNGLIVVMHVVRGQFGPEEGDAILLSTSKMDGKACKIREEQEGGSSGKKVIASHERLLLRFDYEGQTKSVNKIVYAKPFAVRWDAGDVVLMAGEWNEQYLDELCLFPQAKHDDQVDASATSYHELAAHPVSQVTASQVLAGISRADEHMQPASVKIF